MGNSAENNYGFGSSNIGGNIENVTNQLNAGGLNNQQAFGTNSYGNAANSAITQPNSYANNIDMTNQFVQKNNYNSGNNSSILQKFQELYRGKYGVQNPPFSQLKQNTIAPTATETPKRNVYQSLSLVPILRIMKTTLF